METKKTDNHQQHWLTSSQWHAVATFNSHCRGTNRPKNITPSGHMITDIFLKRYQHERFTYREVPGLYVRLFCQAGAIVFEDLWPWISQGENLCSRVHDKLAREIGRGLYRGADTYSKIVKGCLFEGYDCNCLFS